MNQITWNYDLEPAITLDSLFVYAGHTLTVGIFEDETSDDISWECASTSSVTIEGGTYPKHFAELEACDLLSEEIISGKDSVDNAQDMENVIRKNVTRLIAQGVFQLPLQAIINDLFRKGATAREIQDAITKAGK